jgi:hypothetical protein
MRGQQIVEAFRFLFFLYMNWTWVSDPPGVPPPLLPFPPLQFPDPVVPPTTRQSITQTLPGLQFASGLQSLPW